MARTCTICGHSERTAIDRALLAGDSYRDIAGRYEVSKTALERHRSNHLVEQMQAAAERSAEADVRTAIDVVSQLQTINTESTAILREARKAKDGDLALKAIDRIQKQLELQAKLIGDLSDGPTVNITISAEWLSIRGEIVAALAPYPEARQAVAGRLSVIEGGVSHAAD